MKMTFSPMENSLLIEVLHKPRTVRELADKYVGRQSKSRSGFYKALASLRKKEVIIVKKSFVVVNKIWLSDTSSFFASLQGKKRSASYFAEQVATLEDGERLEYTFRSVSETDIFILNLLYDLLLFKKSEWVLIEEAHEFFVLLNRNRTAHILKEIKHLGSSLFLLIHSASTVDKEIVATHLETAGQGYATGKSKSGAKIMHAVGDIIIELRLNKTFTISLDRAYKKQPLITYDFIEKIESLASEKYRHRILIYKDRALGAKMKRRFNKYFV